jgi:hypothetical protein
VLLKKNETLFMNRLISQRGRIYALVCFTVSLTVILIFNKIFPPNYSDKLAEDFQNVKASHPNPDLKSARVESQLIFRLQPGSASSNSLLLLDNIRGDNRFNSAIDTFDNIQSEINKTPPGVSNARKTKTLEALKKKMFIDDFRFIAMSLGLDCSQAEAAFDKVNQSPVKLLDQSVNDDFSDTRSPSSNVIAEYYGRLLDSGNPGYNDILNALSSRDIRDVMNDQILMDSMTYVGLKTYLEQLIEDEVKHGKGIQAQHEIMDGDSNTSKAYAATVTNDVSEMTRILDSYRSIYQRRMTRQLGEKSSEVMDLLGSIKLSGVGMELGVPCL